MVASVVLAGRSLRGLGVKLCAAAGHSHGYLISTIDFRQEAKGRIRAENPLLIAGHGRPIISLMGLWLALLTSSIWTC